MREKRQVLILKDIATAEQALVTKWTAVSEAAVKESGRFVVALSGGLTPIGLFQRLALLTDVLPWSKTHIFFVDERFISQEHTDSNFYLIKQNLLQTVKIPERNIHPIVTDSESCSLAAVTYEQHLVQFFKLSRGELPKFDLILLGIGEDGHTASLFPADKTLEEERLVVATDFPLVKYKRITLTLPVINNAKNIIFLVSGKRKALVLKKIIKEAAALPAALVKGKNGNVSFYIDNEAALYLSEKQ